MLRNRATWLSTTRSRVRIPSARCCRAVAQRVEQDVPAIPSSPSITDLSGRCCMGLQRFVPGRDAGADRSLRNPSLPPLLPRAAVAQPGERLPCKQEVGGAIPLRSIRSRSARGADRARSARSERVQERIAKRAVRLVSWRSGNTGDCNPPKEGSTPSHDSREPTICRLAISYLRSSTGRALGYELRGCRFDSCLGCCAFVVERIPRERPKLEILVQFQAKVPRCVSRRAAPLIWELAAVRLRPQRFVDLIGM